MSKITYRFDQDRMVSLINQYYKKLGRNVSVDFEYKIIHSQDEVISRCVATEYKFIPNTGEISKLHFVITKDEIKRIINTYLSDMNMSLIDLSIDAYVKSDKNNKSYVVNKTYTITALGNRQEVAKNMKLKRNKNN